jgi:putative FmdB family regulatory protein
MPTYDYRCHGCGPEFEVFQSMSAEHLRKCPECGKPKLKRLMGGGAAIVFKGSGFYQTDYRSESYKKSAQADKPAAESTAETKSESKTEAKSKSAAKDAAKTPAKNE